MNITLSEKLSELLDKKADAQNTTPEQYIYDLVSKHLVSGYRDELTSKFNNQSAEKLQELETAIGGVSIE